MADPVEFLKAAHIRAEELANAAAYETEPDWSDGGKHGEFVFHVPLGGKVVVGEFGYLFDQLREFIAANDPTAVLARVAAERAVLDEHANVNDGDCGTCVDGRWGYPTHGGSSPQRWPCRTVRLLAAGWGWTEDNRG